MSWSDRFLDAMRRDHVALAFVLESVEIGRYETTTWAISSHALPGYVACIDPTRSSVSHGELQIPSWGRTAASVRLGLMRSVAGSVKPGQACVLRVGLSTWQASEYEPVLLCCVRGLSWAGGVWSLDLVDLGYSLQSRWVKGDADPRLFANLEDGTTTVASAYTVGDASISVGDTTDFEAPTGEPYLLLISPASGADPFLIVATGTSGGNTFTGVAGVAGYGTTAANAAVGSTVQCVGWSDGHPLQAVRRVLISTGAGGNGARDVLPTSWGYGIPYELVDGEDIGICADLSSPATGADDWLLIATEPQDDGLSFLSDFLAPGGFFLGSRQGKITARCVIDPSTQRGPDEWRLKDGMIESYQAWDPAIVEARRLKVAEMQYLYGLAPALTAYVSASERLETRPALRDVSLPAQCVYTNETAWATSIGYRLAVHLLRRGERITVRCAGFRLAGVSLGDVVELTTDQVQSRFSASGGSFRNRRCLVVGGGPDWFAGVTRLTLIAHDPASETV